MPPCGFQDGFEFGEKLIAGKFASGIFRVRDAGIETWGHVQRADGEFEPLREVVRGILKAVVRAKIDILGDDAVRPFNVDDAAAPAVAVLRVVGVIAHGLGRDRLGAFDGESVVGDLEFAGAVVRHVFGI